MASVEMCGGNHNLMSSYDYLFGFRIHMQSVPCKFEVYATFFLFLYFLLEKRKQLR